MLSVYSVKFDCNLVYYVKRAKNSRKEGANSWDYKFIVEKKGENLSQMRAFWKKMI